MTMNINKYKPLAELGQLRRPRGVNNNVLHVRHITLKTSRWQGLAASPALRNTNINRENNGKTT